MKRLLMLAALALAPGCVSSIRDGAGSQPSGTTELACTSDFQCRRGIEWCAKPYHSITGRCIRPVDEFGLPVYAPPRPASSLVGGPGCLWGPRCPLGFWCDQGYCVR